MRSLNDLRDYQVNSIQFMLDRASAGLFQDMGLGKTASALSVISTLRAFGYGPALVLGPIRVIETVWEQEAQEWEHTQHLKFSLVRGTVNERRRALLAPADVYLINPDLLRWLFKTVRRPYPYDILFVDEASMFKRAGTRRFRALRYKVKYFKRRYTMTGTPAPNRLLELWPHMFIVDQGLRLGQRFSDFKSRFYEPILPDNYDPLHPTKFIPWEAKEGAKEKIYSLIADVVFRTENPDIPRINFNLIKVILPPKVRKLYDDVEDRAFGEIDTDFIDASNAAVAMMKCRQIANGVVYTSPSEFDEEQIVKVKFLHREKLTATKQVVDETGSPVIVVYNFKHELTLLQEELEEYAPITLGKNSAQTIQDWNRGKIQVLLLHPATGGHGLNLQQGGHTMVWFGLTFSYEQYIQTIARINRQGQKNPVIIHLIIAMGTVDLLLRKVLKAKADEEANLFKYLKEYRRDKDSEMQMLQ